MRGRLRDFCPLPISIGITTTGVLVNGGISLYKPSYTVLMKMANVGIKFDVSW